MPANTSSIAEADMHHQEGEDLDTRQTPEIDGTTSSNNDAPDGSGLLTLGEFQSADLMQMVTRCFTEQAAYCNNIKQQAIEKLWREVQAARYAKSDNQEELDQRFCAEVESYYRFVQLETQVHSLEQPGRKHIEKFIGTAKWKFKEAKEGGGEFLEGRLDDWVFIPMMDKLEHLILSIPNYRIGKLLLTPFKWQTTEDEHTTYEHYGGKLFRVLAVGTFNSLIGGFVGFPVALQTLNVTSRVGEVVTYLLCLAGFGIVVKPLLPGLNLALVVTLAYASILAANMRSG
ncbi:Fc.00g051420.m01.CDS01 [Cosmosporella sp. VM-42]